MTTTQLSLYNGALDHLGERHLTSVTENREPRRVLDDIYPKVIQRCLGAGLWNFAKRTAQFDADTGITPNFGEGQIIGKPEDWIRTMKVSADDRFVTPYIGYTDEKDYWVSETTPLYVQYVSNDSGYGEDLSGWPQLFSDYVELEMAVTGCTRITQNASLKADLTRDRDKAKRSALNKDALNEPPMFPPQGSWTRARGGGVSNKERGNPNSFTG